MTQAGGAQAQEVGSNSPGPAVGAVAPSSALLGVAGFEQVSPAKAGALQKVRYTHDAMIDLIIQNPWISQNQIAMHFGYTPGWVSQIFSADSFQSRMAQRKNELVDPAIRATIEERFKALVHQSLAKLQTKLENSPSDELVLRAVEIGAKALGYGARGTNLNVNVQNSFVVEVPGKAVSSAEWEKAYSHPAIEGAVVSSSDEPVNTTAKPVDAPGLLHELQVGKLDLPTNPIDSQAASLLAELTGSPT